MPSSKREISFEQSANCTFCQRVKNAAWPKPQSWVNKKQAAQLALYPIHSSRSFLLEAYQKREHFLLFHKKK
jgi:hypothetical protein